MLQLETRMDQRQLARDKVMHERMFPFLGRTLGQTRRQQTMRAQFRSAIDLGAERFSVLELTPGDNEGFPPARSRS